MKYMAFWATLYLGLTALNVLWLVREPGSPEMWVVTTMLGVLTFFGIVYAAVYYAALHALQDSKRVDGMKQRLFPDRY